MGKCVQTLVVSWSACFALLGCLQNQASNTPQAGTPIENPIEAPIFGPDLNVYPLNKLVCDPFENPDDENQDDGGVIDPDLGFKLQFYDLTSESQESEFVEFDESTRLDAVGFTSHLELRGQSFRDGIKKKTGDVLRARNGDVLPSPFGMKILGALSLASHQSDGEYQLAVLSNAPVRFRMKYEGQWIEVLPQLTFDPANVGMTCSTEAFRLRAGVAYPIEIDVIQTRDASALGLVPIWRLKPKNSKLDPFCENRDRGPKYFDENPRKTPLPAFRSLQARGWYAWRTENIRLPDNEDVNPCIESDQAPYISGFQFEFSGEQIFVSWQTDLPATSQVLYTRSDTGEEVLTISDNVLRKSHRVAIPRNPSGVSYIVRAISVSQNNAKTISGGYTLYGF